MVALDGDVADRVLEKRIRLESGASFRDQGLIIVSLGKRGTELVPKVTGELLETRRMRFTSWKFFEDEAGKKKKFFMQIAMTRGLFFFWWCLCKEFLRVRDFTRCSNFQGIYEKLCNTLEVLVFDKINLNCQSKIYMNDVCFEFTTNQGELYIGVYLTTRRESLKKVDQSVFFFLYKSVNGTYLYCIFFSCKKWP